MDIFNNEPVSSLVLGGLTCIPAGDLNFTASVNRATDKELRQAVAIMEASPKGNTGRLKACRRELRRRGDENAGKS